MRFGSRRFKLDDGREITVHKLRTATEWAHGERLHGLLDDERVTLYFAGHAKTDKLVGIWTTRPPRQIYWVERP